VAVELAPEVEYDPLADVRRPPALGYSDRGRDHGDEDQTEAEDVQPADVLIQDDINELPHEDRRHHAQTGDDEDGDQDPDQPADIGPTVGPDAFEESPIDVRTILILVVLQVAPPATGMVNARPPARPSKVIRG